MGTDSSLTGTHWVRVFKPAWGDAHKWLPKTRDRIELRSHALKLRFWPEKSPDNENGQVLDLDWSWVRVLRSQGHKIGELRIDDAIGGHNNLRIIFYVGDPHPNGKNPLPIIWILTAFQKKRQEFTGVQIEIFKARKLLVIERFYKNREFE